MTTLDTFDGPAIVIREIQSNESANEPELGLDVTVEPFRVFGSERQLTVSISQSVAPGLHCPSTRVPKNAKIRPQSTQEVSDHFGTPSPAFTRATPAGFQ